MEEKPENKAKKPSAFPKTLRDFQLLVVFFVNLGNKDKMNKLKTLILCIVILSGQIFAQKGFYIKPYLETKADMSYYYGKTPYNNNPYFKFGVQKIIYPSNLSPMNIGLLVGYTFNSGIAIETGIGEEINTSGYTLDYHYLSFDSLSFYHGQPGVSEGTSGHKIPILLTLPLFKFDSVRIYNSKNYFSWRLKLKLGINFYRQFVGGWDPLITDEVDSIIVAPHTRLDYSDALYTERAKSVLYQIGLESELNFKRVRGLYLSFYYLYGRRALSTISVRVTINQQTSYYYNTYGTGSGFCLQLSKRISLNPKDYRRHKKKQLLK